MEALRLKSSVKDLKSSNLWVSLAAECLGTFALVYIGSMASYDGKNVLNTAIGFGLGGTVAIFCIGNISGGNINPAVSLGLLIARQISLVRFVLYFIAQTVGAKIAEFSARAPAKTSNMTDLNATMYDRMCNMKLRVQNHTTKDKMWNMTLRVLDATGCDRIVYNMPVPEPPKAPDPKIILCEIIITFFLVFTVMRMCVEKTRSKNEKAFAPLIIGVAILLGVLAGGRIGSGCMNPAAAIVTKKGKGIIGGSMLGGVLAALSQQLLFTSELSLQHLKNYMFDSEFKSGGSDESEGNTEEHELK